MTAPVKVDLFPCCHKLLLTTLLFVSCTYAKNAFDLQEEVFANCSQKFRPSKNQSVPIQVEVSVYPFQINTIDVVQQILDIILWCDLYWTNDFVSWDPEEYSGVTRMEFDGDDDVWTPDIIFYNQFAGDHPAKSFKTPGFMDQNGRTATWTPMQGVFVCAMDGKYFPFDSHECVMTMVSWTHNIFMLNLTLGYFNSDNLVDSSTWELISYTGEYEFREIEGYSGGYARVHFYLTVKRKSAFYVGTVILPGIAVNYLSLANFLIPMSSGERIGFGVTIFLAQVFNLMIASTFMPQGGTSLALWGQYLLFCITLIASFLMTTAVLMTVFHHPVPDRAMKETRRKFILHRLTPILGPKLVKSQPKGTRKIFVAPEKSEKSDLKEKENSWAEEKPPSLDVQREVEIAVETINRVCGVVSAVVLTVVSFTYALMVATGDDD